MGYETYFPVIEVSGTPYEIGYGHGSQARKQVLNCINTYQAMFRDYSGIDWKDAKTMSRQYIEPIGNYCADYLDELRGVADGAGVEFEDILALNARSELVFQGNVESDGCTAICVTPDRSRDSDMLLGQNWDWKITQRESMILLKIRQKNGKPDIMMFTEAGIIGKIGMNSAGIGICLNALSVDAPPRGLPLHYAMRGVLDSENLTQAIRAICSMQLACAVNLMVAHKNGEAVSVEVANNDFDVLYPKDGILVHSNHFISPRLPRHPFTDQLKYSLPDSFIRLHRADRLLRAIPEPIGQEDIESIFRDHGEYPCGLCRHDDPSLPPEKRLYTVFSVLMNLTKGEAYLCPTQPCEAPYKTCTF